MLKYSINQINPSKSRFLTYTIYCHGKTSFCSKKLNIIYYEYQLFLLPWVIMWRKPIHFLIYINPLKFKCFKIHLEIFFFTCCTIIAGHRLKNWSKIYIQNQTWRKNIEKGGGKNQLDIWHRVFDKFDFFYCGGKKWTEVF